jgi:dolichol-phosphate mannosyltransferase
MTSVPNSIIDLAANGASSVQATPLAPPARRDEIELSVVVPAYNEACNVPALLGALDATLCSLGASYEIVVVDDGSRDATWSVLRAAAERYPGIVGLRLSRNFGHQSALLAGLAHAHGRAVVSMDADLQHPPGVIPALVDAWRGGAQVVRTVRRDVGVASPFKRLTSRYFYAVFSYLTGIPMHEGMSDFRLLDRRVLDELLRLRHRDLFLRGSVEWLGYRTVTVPFDVAARHAGASTYTLRRMLRFASGAVISFSSKPLRLGVWLGLCTGALSLVEIAYVVVQYMRGETVPGWASLTAVVSFLFAVLFVVLGIMGLYIARIHEILQNRPPYVVGESTEGVDVR